MLNQKERHPLSVADQVASIYAGTGGYLDRIRTDRVQEFLDRLLSGLHSEQGDLMQRINDSGELSDEDENALGDAIAEAIDDFGPNFDEEGQPLEEGESDRVREHRDEEEEREEGEDREEAEGQEQGEPDREEVPA
jgi:F-type H+-transporting ATPase subunit alpha